MQHTKNKMMNTFMNTKSRILFSALLVLVLFIVLYSLFRSEGTVARSNELVIAEVKKELFVEFTTAEGIVQPYSTVRINTLETGTVDRIVWEEGSMVKEGDTLFVITNSDLLRQIDDARSDFEKQMIAYQEREIVMQQQTINLKRQSLQTTYELNRLKKSFALDQEEFKMGVKSKAQLDVSSDEYDYKVKSTALQLEALQQDSMATATRKRIMEREVERERNKLKAIEGRAYNLVITAPISGQLSFIRAIKGQRVNSGDNIAEIKVVDRFKIHSQLEEKWIDHCYVGQEGSLKVGDQSFPLRLSKVSPEVKDRKFEVDLLFTENIPQNIRLGRVYPVRINLTEEHEALVVPKGYFIESNGGRWMYRVDTTGTSAEKVQVILGGLSNNKYEVLDGLHQGDRVIISSYEYFREEDVITLK